MVFAVERSRCSRYPHAAATGNVIAQYRDHAFRKQFDAGERHHAIALEIAGEAAVHDGERDLTLIEKLFEGSGAGARIGTGEGVVFVCVQHGDVGDLRGLAVECRVLAVQAH